MAKIRCFWLTFAGQERLSLRRYASRTHGDCSAMPGPHGYHDALTFLMDVPARIVPSGAHPRGVNQHEGPKTRAEISDDTIWPTRCACGYVFAESDEWQVFGQALYQRADTGALTTLREAPAGAMWDAWWLAELKGGYYFGPGSDGYVLTVKTPGGDWTVDARASNCTLPKDDEHRCWVRHGTVPDITVDKKGRTCAAGGGSIRAGNYHGFLRHGHLVQA